MASSYESSNLGKRLLYGFASSLFIGLALPVFIASKVVNGLPTWFGWLLLPSFALAFWFGYKFPQKFEKIFTQILNQRVNTQKTDLHQKTSVSLGWFFFFLILICFGLLFTRFLNIVPYIFIIGFFSFLFLVFRNSKQR